MEILLTRTPYFVGEIWDPCQPNRHVTMRNLGKEEARRKVVKEGKGKRRLNEKGKDGKFIFPDLYP